MKKLAVLALCLTTVFTLGTSVSADTLSSTCLLYTSGYRMNTMNKQEINEFIEKMEEVGDVWTEEQVNDVYGDCS